MPKVNRMAYLNAAHEFTIKEEPIPKPGPGQVLVQVKANGICGSDLHFWKRGDWVTTLSLVRMCPATRRQAWWRSLAKVLVDSRPVIQL